MQLELRDIKGFVFRTIKLIGIPICILSGTQLKAQSFYIDQWGLADYHGWPILNDSTTSAGYAAMGGEIRNGWAALRGSFGRDITISKDSAIVVRGQIEFVGGSGGSDYMAFRYALTYQADEGELLYVGTDSTQWSVNGEHNGYGFHPRSGTAVMSNGNGGPGTLRSIYNGNWASSYVGRPLAAINQAPRDAEIVAGTYNFAISVYAANDSTNDIRWLMIEEHEKYWFGGAVEGEAATTIFNGIEFGINGGEYTRFNVIGMEVYLGDPIDFPSPCWGCANYIENWGFIGDRYAGWITTPGEVAGNVSISGDIPNTELTAVRGEFFQTEIPVNGQSFIVQGKLELESGGFEATNSLRFGIFNSANAGELIGEPQDSMHWTGSEDKHSGYLFIPPSGVNNLANWGGANETGSWGAVVDAVWHNPGQDSTYTLGTQNQYPGNAVAGSGVYDFEISISLADSGGREIRFKLIKKDGTYGYAGSAIDNNDRFDTDYFNCLSFALDSGNTTTALNLKDVLTTYGDPITLPEWVTSAEQPETLVPANFSLSQNYPNPFNPVTEIKYALPRNSYISLKIYNLLGQEVASIFEGQQKAGYHSAVFNGSALSSGLYLYRLQARHFAETRKLILLK